MRKPVGQILIECHGLDHFILTEMWGYEQSQQRSTYLQQITFEKAITHV